MIESDAPMQGCRVSTPRSVRRLLTDATVYLAAARIESARCDAEALLQSALGWSKEQLYASLDAVPAAEQSAVFQEVVARRERREPLAYITGQKEFWSLDLIVTPAVLVPRPETELLVEVAAALAKRFDPRSEMRVLDLGTGSGALAVAIAKEVGRARIWATDVSAAALEIAGRNAKRHGVADRLHFSRGDLFEAIGGRAGDFHLIVSNPPYVRRGDLGELAPEIVNWEPVIALDGGVDGLDYYRPMIAGAAKYLDKDGSLALEIGAGMAEPVTQLIDSAAAYTAPALYRDYGGRERVVVARKRPGSAN